MTDSMRANAVLRWLDLLQVVDRAASCQCIQFTSLVDQQCRATVHFPKKTVMLLLPDHEGSACLTSFLKGSSDASAGLSALAQLLCYQTQVDPSSTWTSLTCANML